MRILFFLEPVIFREQPAGVSAHFMWVECFRRAAVGAGGEFALVANRDVLDAWRASDVGSCDGTVLFELDSFGLLEPFAFSRADYCRALFEATEGSNPFVSTLTPICDRFQPDVVVMTAQNALAQAAFGRIPTVFVEQSPLPRLGHALRTAIDPCGHQDGAVLQRHADRIRNLKLTKEQAAAAARLVRAMRRAALAADPRASKAISEIEAVQAGAKVALLATQPRDAVTYEGAYQDISMEDLVFSWAEALPPGWVGVPTYHAGQRLSPSMERSLSRATQKLHFLPADWSQGLSEPLCLAADAVVTISSTTAMTALLFGKRAVVTGRSPFACWGVKSPQLVDTAPLLSAAQIGSTLAFLTHRHSLAHEALMRHPEDLASHLKSLLAQPEPAEWLLDLREWTAEKAAALFTFSFCFSPATENIKGCERGRLTEQLARQTMEFDSVRTEWHRAVAERDGLLEARDALTQAVEASRVEREAMQAQDAALRAEIGGLQHRLDESLLALAEERSGREAQGAEVIRLQGLLGDSERALADLRGGTAELSQRLQRADSEMQRVLSELTQANERALGWNTTALASQSEVVRLTELVTTERLAAERFRAESEHAHRALEDLRSQIAARRSEIALCEERHQLAQRESLENMVALRVQTALREDMERRAESAEARSASTQAELQEVLARMATARKQLDSLQSAVELAEAERAKAAAESEFLRQDAEEKSGLLEASRAELSRVAREREIALSAGREYLARLSAGELDRVAWERRALEAELDRDRAHAATGAIQTRFAEIERLVWNERAALRRATTAHGVTARQLALEQQTTRLLRNEISRLRRQMGVLWSDFGRLANRLRAAEVERDMLSLAQVRVVAPPGSAELEQGTPSAGIESSPMIDPRHQLQRSPAGSWASRLRAWLAGHR